MGQWAQGKKEVWNKVCDKYGGNKDAFDWGTWAFFDWSLGKAWPTIGTASKARKFGWQRYDDTFETWIETSKSFENGGVLPRQSRSGQGSSALCRLAKESCKREMGSSITFN